MATDSSFWETLLQGFDYGSIEVFTANSVVTTQLNLVAVTLLCQAIMCLKSGFFYFYINCVCNSLSMWLFFKGVLSFNLTNIIITKKSFGDDPKITIRSFELKVSRRSKI